MLYTKDGNNSLKCVLKQRMGDNDMDSDDTMALSQRSCELPTMQFVGGDRYLSRDFIDSFIGKSFVVLTNSLQFTQTQDNPCAGRWKNMKDKKTRKMWGVFDESGIFMVVCRHGYWSLSFHSWAD
ncbi:uncharacterized protein F5147DRAFT_572782 [Suillus discolor]|uniref:Uncharacterized protein n=1 Tax=Suillus discolor TaxID=1912936 RepID=A0A9P7JW56_9AGAM|nr:uncharacterized protein F5147DRAFT_572782 [Suillus discolor]KAG2111900.1 hypothetical protein F5147DRAFT_572782 [Suillus discolor]